MKANWMIAVLPCEILWGGEPLDITVCNLGKLPDSVVAHAKKEAGLIFHLAGIQISWLDCGQEPRQDGWLLVRLRNDPPPRLMGPSSLDVMGRAYLSPDGEGQMADAYFPSR